MTTSPLPNDRARTEGVPAGRLEARYLAFLETVAGLRPKLHRYCARMTGSALDGEDVVQETLFQAYRKLDTFDDARPLAPWLFRIACHRCIDFLRQRGTREQAEAKAAGDEAGFTAPVEPVGPALGAAVEHLVIVLPPKERACVLLKDVFDHSLEEIAELVDSTVGGVKAALHRGRAKLLAQPPTEGVAARAEAGAVAAAEGDVALIRLYVDRFNRRDWTGVRELIAADARLRVVDRFAGPLHESPYFGVYERLEVGWRLAAGEIDGTPVAVIEESRGEGWAPRAVVRLRIAGGRIVDLTDYWLCPWVVATAGSLRIDQAS